MNQNKTILIIVAVAIIALGLGIWYFTSRQMETPDGIACTQEAMLCPDGSYVGRTGPKCEFSACPPVATSTVDTSNWKTYASNEFGFSFKYPADWQKSNDSLTVVTPHVFFGHPLNGLTTYSFKVFVYDNPGNLSAADFVNKMIGDATAVDASNAGSAPMTAPQYRTKYEVRLNGLVGYELSGVFEFDHRGEQIYVQQNKQMLVFDFPIGDANPNISDASSNNAIAHQILNTLKVDSEVWKFCGGIAAGQFQCANGYSCKLDGNFPDAGGHCVKN